MSNFVNRTCAECTSSDGTDMPVERGNVHNIVLYDGKYYHTDCFIELCNKKIAKRKNKKWLDALKDIDKLEKNAVIATSEYFDKDDIFKHIVNTYDVTVIPSYIWIKLNKIYSGELSGMTTGIPPAHLYDMWKRQYAFLNKVYSQNKTKGKDMDKIQRLNYDLSVLVNKYDSYISWLEKQKILESDNKIKSENVTKINYQKLSNMNTKSENFDDIDNLLDELF